MVDALSFRLSVFNRPGIWFIDGATAVGGCDIPIVKVNPATGLGSRAFTKLYGSVGVDSGEAVTTDTLGNIYVTGFTMYSYDGQLQGSSDVFMLKVDSSGNTQKVLQFGSSGADFGYDISIDTDGNIYIVGSTAGSLNSQIFAGGTADGFLIKYTKDYHIVYTYQFGSSGYDQGRSVKVDNEGNVYVFGRVSGSINNVPAIGGDSDFVLMKCSAISGRPLWTQIYGSKNKDDDVGFFLNMNLRMIYTVGNIEKGNKFRNDSGMTFYAHDFSGMMQFNVTRGLNHYGCGVYGRGKGLAIDTVANVAYITGIAQCGIDGINYALDGPMVLWQYRLDGTWINTIGFGATKNDIVGAVVVDGVSNVYVSGGVKGPLNGQIYTNPFGKTDAFYLRYTQDPSAAPTYAPSNIPSTAPTAPTYAPTKVPSTAPTCTPSNIPSKAPTHSPSSSPSLASAFTPSNLPNRFPTAKPTHRTAETTPITSTAWFKSVIGIIISCVNILIVYLLRTRVAFNLIFFLGHKPRFIFKKDDLSLLSHKEIGIFRNEDGIIRICTKNDLTGVEIEQDDGFNKGLPDTLIKFLYLLFDDLTFREPLTECDEIYIRRFVYQRDLIVPISAPYLPCVKYYFELGTIAGFIYYCVYSIYGSDYLSSLIEKNKPRSSSKRYQNVQKITKVVPED